MFRRSSGIGGRDSFYPNVEASPYSCQTCHKWRLQFKLSLFSFGTAVVLTKQCKDRKWSCPLFLSLQSYCPDVTLSWQLFPSFVIQKRYLVFILIKRRNVFVWFYLYQEGFVKGFCKMLCFQSWFCMNCDLFSRSYWLIKEKMALASDPAFCCQSLNITPLWKWSQKVLY